MHRLAQDVPGNAMQSFDMLLSSGMLMILFIKRVSEFTLISRRYAWAISICPTAL